MLIITSLITKLLNCHARDYITCLNKVFQSNPIWLIICYVNNYVIDYKINKLSCMHVKIMSNIRLLAYVINKFDRTVRWYWKFLGPQSLLGKARDLIWSLAGRQQVLISIRMMEIINATYIIWTCGIYTVSMHD